MYYYYLSVLKNILSEEQCDNLGAYFCTLTTNTRDLITVSKISKLLDIDNKIALSALIECEKAGFLDKQYGIICPECDALIKMLSVESYENNWFQKKVNCYDCDNVFEVNDDNIIVYFKLVIDVSPFANGQQSRLKSEKGVEESAFVAQENTLTYYKKIAEKLEIIADNQEHEHKYRESLELAKKKDVELEEKAIKKYKRNKIISICLSLIGYTILVSIIIYVYKVYGFEKISVFVTFGSSLISFIFNFVIYSLFPRDIDLIKRLQGADW